MKTKHAALALFASFALGGLAGQALHAQAKPPVYFIAENELTNPEAYAKEYLPRAQEIIKSHGGRYVAAGKATPIEGEPPKSRVVVLAWDSMEEVQAWRNSPEFKEHRKIGDLYAKFRAFAIEGVPQ